MDSTVKESPSHPRGFLASAYLTEALRALRDSWRTEMEDVKAESSFLLRHWYHGSHPSAFGFLKHFCNYISKGPVEVEGIKLSRLRLTSWRMVRRSSLHPGRASSGSCGWAVDLPRLSQILMGQGLGSRHYPNTGQEQQGSTCLPSHTGNVLYHCHCPHPHPDNHRAKDCAGTTGTIGDNPPVLGYWFLEVASSSNCDLMNQTGVCLVFFSRRGASENSVSENEIVPPTLQTSEPWLHLPLKGCSLFAL